MAGMVRGERGHGKGRPRRLWWWHGASERIFKHALSIIAEIVLFDVENFGRTEVKEALAMCGTVPPSRPVPSAPPAPCLVEVYPQDAAWVRQLQRLNRVG